MDFCANAIKTRTAEDRFQRGAFGRAITAARPRLRDVDDVIEDHEAMDFIQAAVDRLMGTGPVRGFTISFDLKAGDLPAARTDLDASVIHLDPRRINKLDLVHELTHLLTPDDGHGAHFAGLFLELVRLAIGDEAQDLLHACYSENQVTHVLLDFDSPIDQQQAPHDCTGGSAHGPALA